MTDDCKHLDAALRARRPYVCVRVADGASVTVEGGCERFVRYRRDPDGDLYRMGRSAFERAYMREEDYEASQRTAET